MMRSQKLIQRFFLFPSERGARGGLFFYLVIIICFTSVSSTAQYNLKQNSVWAFGDSTGLDFNSGFPIPIRTNIQSFEAVSSVCDTSGQLLFYSNGDSVWNKSGNVMLNGSSLIPDQTALSSTQGSLIVPVIGSYTQYYLFSIEESQLGYGSTCRMYYSIVDMTLDNGLGSIIPNKKSIIMDSFLSEKMIAIPGDNCNIWVLVHGRQDHTFKAYSIDNTGINLNPVTSNCGNINGLYAYETGVMKISHNRNKLVVCAGAAVTGMNQQTDQANDGVELYDFNPLTGQVSNPEIIDTGLTFYGACFSSDDSKLYISAMNFITFQNSSVSQFDLSNLSLNAIKSSKTNVYVSPPGYISDLRLGPDSRIFVTHNFDSLDYIDSPNLKGSACHYIPNAFFLPSGSNIDIFYQFPNEYMTSLCRTDVDKVETSSNSISIYPNPAKGLFTVDGIVGGNETTIQIVNTIGQVVYSKHVTISNNKLHWQMNTRLTQGVYTMEIIDYNGKKIPRQIIIQ